MADFHPPQPPKKHVIRERFEDLKDDAIDSAMDKRESWAKKVGYNNSGVMLDDIPKLLKVLKLRVVDISRTCITQEQLEEYKAYETLARRHLLMIGGRAPDFEDDE